MPVIAAAVVVVVVVVDNLAPSHSPFLPFPYKGYIFTTRRICNFRAQNWLFLACKTNQNFFCPHYFAIMHLTEILQVEV